MRIKGILNWVRPFLVNVGGRTSESHSRIYCFEWGIESIA